MGEYRICIQSWSKKLQRWLMAIALGILAMQCLTTPVLATGVYNIPALNPDQPTWVIDQGEVLSLVSETALEKNLSNLARETGQEVRLVTIRRLDYGETAESFADELFAKWFPTSQAQANQTLIFLDSLTNTAAIRSGAAVKALLPDAVARSVAQETLLVPIRQGNYNQGFLDASDRLSAVLAGRPDPGPPQVKERDFESKFAEAKDTDDRSATILVVGLLIAATVIPMVTYFFYQGQG